MGGVLSESDSVGVVNLLSADYHVTRTPTELNQIL